MIKIYVIYPIGLYNLDKVGYEYHGDCVFEIVKTIALAFNEKKVS